MDVMDVIVIGCGASGIAALRKLYEADLKVLGLEAADRIGGRINSVEYGDRYLDLGAAWCVGEKDDNIVFEIANPLDLLERPEPDHKYFVLSNGDVLPNDKSNLMLKVLDNELALSDKNTVATISDCLKNAAKTNSTLQQDPILARSFIEWFEKNIHVGGQKDPKTAKSLKSLTKFWNSAENPLLNWKGKGYKMILDVLLNKYPDASKELPITIHLKKEVELVKWKSDKKNTLVQIKCTDGGSYTAKNVIITLSLGVLKERHSQLFDPPLPAEKITSINTLQLCVLDRIYVEFTEPWWPETPACFNILWKEEDKTFFSDEEQWVMDISRFNTVRYHPNVLLIFVYGEGAKKMELISEDKVKITVVRLLEVFFKKEFNVTPVKAILRSQWASNPLIRGSYSYRSVATEENGGSAELLSEPLYHGNFPAVCFAGEATSQQNHLTVHGAIESGFREAERIIANLKK